jgi:hypothetical protein
LTPVQVHIVFRLSSAPSLTAYVTMEGVSASSPTLNDTRSPSIRSSPGLNDARAASVQPVEALLNSTSLLSTNLALLNHSTLAGVDPFLNRLLPSTPPPKSSRTGKDHVEGLASAIKVVPGLREDGSFKDQGVRLKAMKTLVTFQWNPDELEGVLLPTA